MAVRTVVPELREDWREHVLSSVCINDLKTIFSSSRGKSASSTIILGRLSRTKLAASFPPWPSKT